MSHAHDSAAYLLIRRSDFDHLVRAGLLEPAGWGRDPYDRRDTFSVPLYRTGALDGLARRNDINWDAVRTPARGTAPCLRPFLAPTGTRKARAIA